MSTYTPPAGSKQATIGGGCFWCLEACYQLLKGVYHVESGYSGGQLPNPTYEQVCGKKTGHAEVVQITYDPEKIAFKDLLDVFFTIHDPTTPNRQGNDVGPQYRSIILYHDNQQKQDAEEAIQKVASEQWFGSRPIVTEVVPLGDNYYPAEKYHQNYYRQNPGQGYCAFVVGPKVQKFRSKFMSQLTA